MNIRFAETSDLPFIYQSLTELFTEAQVIERSSQNQDTLAAILFSENPTAEVLLAMDSEEAAGLALFSMTNRNFPLFAGPGIYLHDLYVKPDCRRKGMATKLINHLKNIAQKRSCTRIDWVLLRNNQAGKDFYESIENAGAVDYIQYMRIPCAG